MVDQLVGRPCARIVMEAGRASWTARRVAAQRLRFDRVAADYGSVEDDRRLHSDVAAGVDTSYSELTGYLQARTLFVDRAVVGALDAGIGQVLVVGSGYDGRAWRYAREGARWFELDHPDTQVDKIERVRRLGLPTQHIAFIAAEIGRDDLHQAVTASGFGLSAPAVVVCEGLVSYLPPEVPGPLFTTLRELCAAGSRLAVELPLEYRRGEAPEKAARARRERLAHRVRQLGEPLRTRFRVEDLVDTIASWGWQPQWIADPAGRPLAESAAGAAFVLARAQ